MFNKWKGKTQTGENITINMYLIKNTCKNMWGNKNTCVTNKYYR